MPPLVTPIVANELLNFPRYFSSFAPKTANLLHPTRTPHSPTKGFGTFQRDALPRNHRSSFIELLKITSRRRSQRPSLFEIEHLHCRAIKAGLDRDKHMGYGLLNLFAKFGSLRVAHDLFDEMLERDTLAWSILISGYCASGDYKTGLRLFFEMLIEGVFPNQFTLSSVLKCCVNCGDVAMGRELHGWILRSGVELDVVLQNSMLELYAKFGAFQYAKKIFELMAERDAVSWNVMIGMHLHVGDTCGSMELFHVSPFRDVSSWNTIINGHIQDGAHRIALQLLSDMVKTGPEFNQFTYSISLVLAGKLVLLELGKQIHARILRMGFEHDEFIRTSLIDMYCKCCKMKASEAIFDCMFKNNAHCLISTTITWSSMMAGYVQNGKSEEALAFFQRMLQGGIKADAFTLTSTSSACSEAGILEQGRQVHAFVQKLGHGSDTFLASAITDMYAKCGSLEDAHKAFDSIGKRNIVLWTSLIGAYAMYGRGKEAILLYEKMLGENIMPNEISFVSVLSACSHSGLVEEGHRYFRSMQEDYGIVPCVEHFTCMVDLFGRAGLLNQAEVFIHENNISHHSVVWKALLSASRVHNNVEMAACASEHLIELEPFDVGSFVLLSNAHASRKNWKEVSKMRSLMYDKGVRKQPGKSWIQFKGKVHTFLVGDRSHPQAEEIYSYLETLIRRLKEMGYSSRTDIVLHDLEEEQKESALNFHSEKLAIAYGIISTPRGSPIRVMKNLRVCADCHVAIKYITAATHRKIILRDAHRFHHFEDGQCSCGDYW